MPRGGRPASDRLLAARPAGVVAFRARARRSPARARQDRPVSPCAIESTGYPKLAAPPDGSSWNSRPRPVGPAPTRRTPQSDSMPALLPEAGGATEGTMLVAGV